MKTLSVCLVCVAGLLACAPFVAGDERLMQGSSRESYAIGHDLGAQTLDRLRADGVDVDLEAFLRGMKDALRESPGAMSEAEIEDSLAVVERRVATREAERRYREDPAFKAAAEGNARAGREFRAEFAGRDGVRTLSEGVMYTVSAAGTGARVTPESTVVASFTATLLDGTVIGEADRREVRVASTLEGGREALERMRVGDRWALVLGPEKAFGLPGRAPDVGPNETVLVEVEVHDVVR